MVRFTALLTMAVLVTSTSPGAQSTKTPTLVITRGGSRRKNYGPCCPRACKDPTARTPSRVKHRARNNDPWRTWGVNPTVRCSTEHLLFFTQRHRPVRGIHRRAS